MCSLLRKPVVFRLALGIIIMFILCLPEFFKIHEANTVMMSCMDVCSSSNTTFPLCTFNNSYKRLVQQRREKQTILLKVIVNNFNFQNIPCIYQSSWREPSYPKQRECDSKRNVNVDHQGSGSIAKKTKGLLEAKTENVTYFYKYLNFTTVSKKEVEHNMNYLMEIHINYNSTAGRRNAADEQLNHSCLLAMMEDQNDCINISLQLMSYMEYPMCMTKIAWLTMIPVVFVITVSIVIYKIVQENKRNYYKHKVATSVSAVLRRKGSRYARRTVSATKIHPFPVKPSKQQIPIPAQTTKILPVIPEQEHCHVDHL